MGMYFGKMRHAYNISKKHNNQILNDTRRSIPTSCTLKPHLINIGKTNINVKNNNRYYRHSNTEPGCPKRRTPGGPGLEGTEEGTPTKCSLGGSRRRSNGASGGKHTYKHIHTNINVKNNNSSNNNNSPKLKNNNNNKNR